MGQAVKDDWKEWVEKWVKDIEKADEQGNTKEVHRGVRALSGKSKNYESKQSTKKKNGDLIQSSTELGELWQEFLTDKFSALDLEDARKGFEDIGPNDGEGSLTYEEFTKVVGKMKSHKATGPDGIPAEVWQNSALAMNELFFFIKTVWDRECVPKSLVLCMFVMIHKKGSSEDCSKY